MKYTQVKFLNKYNVQIVKMYSEKSVCETKRYVNYSVNLNKLTQNEIESIKNYCENNNLRFSKSKFSHFNTYYIRFTVNIQ